MSDTITRWECPECRRAMVSFAGLCSGSFLDTDHPANVPPVERTYAAVDALEAWAGASAQRRGVIRAAIEEVRVTP